MWLYIYIRVIYIIPIHKRALGISINIIYRVEIFLGNSHSPWSHLRSIFGGYLCDIFCIRTIDLYIFDDCNSNHIIIIIKSNRSNSWDVYTLIRNNGWFFFNVSSPTPSPQSHLSITDMHIDFAVNIVFNVATRILTATWVE